MTDSQRTATHNTNCTAPCACVLYLALDLGAGNWKLAFTVGLGQKPRVKTITARSTLSLVLEIKAAKRRFSLPEDAPVLCCYEAGRDGFWLHRFLLAHGVQNQVVDSSSIEVNRRQRRAKSDCLDAVKLVDMLIRWHNGTDQENSASFDQQGGAVRHDRARFEEIGAWISVARHAVKSAEVGWTQDVA